MSLPIESADSILARTELSDRFAALSHSRFLQHHPSGSSPALKLTAEEMLDRTWPKARFCGTTRHRNLQLEFLVKTSPRYFIRYLCAARTFPSCQSQTKLPIAIPLTKTFGIQNAWKTEWPSSFHLLWYPT